MKKVYKIIIPILIIVITFLVLPQTTHSAAITLKIGDTNEDGKIDSRDTLRILEHIAASTVAKIRQNHPNWILSAEKLKCADINGDGVIDSRDTLKELEYIAATTIPKINQKHPKWKTYLETKWTIVATSIELNKTNLILEKGKNAKLEGMVKPSDATNRIIIWSSSDTNIATVDGIGNVTGIGKGVAIITAKASNGVYKTCEVRVNEQTSGKQEKPVKTETNKKVKTRIEDEKIKVNGRTITKAQYANFRNVSGGNLGKNVLYRCINPIHGKERYKTAAYYADQMLKEHKVNAILNLDNDSSSIKKSSYSKSTYYRSLFKAGKVCARAIGGVREERKWQKKIVDRIKFFTKHEGPYAVHCWIGRDRTGFTIILLECLMNVPYEKIYNDYIKSDENFRISGRFNINTISSFSNDLKIITGKSAANKKHPKASDWKNINFVKCAEKYLRDGGMTNSEIKKLKNNLSKNYE